MKDIKVGNYSIYSDGYWESTEQNFIKLYKGVRVSANKENDYIWFSIRTKKVKDTIWVRGEEKIYDLLFNDDYCSISCDCDKKSDNKSKDRLEFDKEVYEELKINIPEFIKEQGIEFELEERTGSLILRFYR